MGKHLRICSLLLLLAYITWPVFSAEALGGFVFTSPGEETENNYKLDRELDSELQKLQMKLDELQIQLQRANEQKSTLSKLLGQLEVRGSSRTQLRNFQLSGSGIDTQEDFLGRLLWYDSLEPGKQLTGSKANEQIKLTLIGRPIPQVELAGNIDFNFTWAGNKSLGPADGIYIKANFDTWQTIAGTYWAQFSPLTLFYQSEEPRYESEFFAQKRKSALEEWSIKGTARRLEGFYGKLEMDELQLQGLVARVGTSPYHRFLWGLEGNLATSPKLNLTGTWVSLKDDPASANTGKAVESQLLGFAGKYILQEKLAFRGEYVRSSYDDDTLRGLPPALDSASVGELLWSGNNLKLRGMFVNVGTFYWAPTAQSRDYTLKDPTIFGSALALDAMGGKVGDAHNQALPYGLATPNRRGIQFGLNYQTPAGASFFAEHWQLAELRPTLEGQLTDNFAKRRNFYVERIGGEVSLAGLIKSAKISFPLKPTKLRGQWERRHTTRAHDSGYGGETELAKTQIISDLGLTYQLAPGWHLLLAGKRQSWRDSVLATEKSQDTLGVGVRAKLNSFSFIQLSWERIIANDALGSIAGLVVETEF